MKYNYDLITNWFERRNLDIQYYNGNTIIVADWNKVPKAMERFLDKEHDLYFEDDGGSCSQCGDFVHREFPQIWLECDVLCKQCALANPSWVYDEFIFHVLEEPYRYKALPDWFPVPKDFDLFDCGMESGLYRGMNDTPEKAVKNVKEQMGTNWEGVFKIDSSNPFMIEFSIYTRRLG